MHPRLREDGPIVLPRRAEGPGGLIGDGAELIGPEDPRYRPTLEALEARRRITLVPPRCLR